MKGLTMTYPDDCTLPEQFLEQLAQKGLEGLPEMVRILNEASCLRLVSALLMEISEEWETGKVYLSFEEQQSSTELEGADLLLQKRTCTIQKGLWAIILCHVGVLLI